MLRKIRIRPFDNELGFGKSGNGRPKVKTRQVGMYELLKNI